MNTDGIQYFDEFEYIIESAGVDRQEICLTGSAPLVLHGVRKNGDIDFSATAEARSIIKQYAKEQETAVLKDSGKVEFPPHIEMSRPDRYDTIGLDDAEIIHDDEKHIVVDGYKILRPELALSIKGAERRPKDVDDIELIEESGITDSPDWDWSRVTLVPPWERPSPSDSEDPSLVALGLRSLRSEGMLTTSKKTVRFILSRFGRWARNTDTYQTYERSQRYTEPVTDDLRYPLPNLISRQYDESNNFIRTVPALLLAMEGDNRFDDVLNSVDDSGGSGIVVTPRGTLHSGLRHVARTILDEQYRLAEAAPGFSFRTEVSATATPQRLERELTDEEETVLEERRQQLLVETDASFHIILWPPIQEYFDEAEDIIRSELQVFDSNDYHVGRRFDTFVRDLYAADRRNDDWFRETKLSRMRGHEPNIRVLDIEIPDPSFRISKGHTINKTLYELKLDFRRKFQTEFGEYLYATDMHTTDNFHHNAHVETLLDRIDEDGYRESDDST